MGCLKAVILSLHPQARIVDLCHGISPQNILQAASILETTYGYFPEGSIFVCIVDPGVGTNRNAVAVKSRRSTFVGPDNGVLSLALAREKILGIRKLTNRKFYRSETPSSTFHGRDIFAPVAARLAMASGVGRFSELGPALKSIHKLSVPRVKRSAGRLRGAILYFDHFGNAMTNIARRDAPETFWRKAEISLKGRRLGRLCRTYADSRQLIALLNSFDQLEIALPNGSAKEAASLRCGDEIQIQS